MNNVGRQTVKPGTTNLFVPGQGCEYVEIINESPYILSCNFEGMGTMDVPAWHLQDIQVRVYDKNGYLLNQPFNGQLFITPANITTGQASAPSKTVSINTYAVGELDTPQSVSLARVITNTQGIITAGFAAQSVFNGSLNPTITLGDNTPIQTLFIDAIDVFLINNGSAAVVIQIEVDGTVAGPLDFFYVVLVQSATIGGIVDHISFLSRGQGLPQLTSTAITINITFPGSIGTTHNSSVVVHHHYEANY